MTPERWRQVDQLFAAALERPAPERDRFLAEACGADEGLRQEVTSLLEADREVSGLLDSTPPRLRDPAAPAVGRDPSEESLLPSGHHLGPYEVRGLLAAGGMGQVYRAHDPRLRRDVAVKVLSPSRRSPEESRRLEREARAAAALAHPNLLAVLDVGRDGDLTYVVSELLEGETLRERLMAGPLPATEALAYARQIAAGLLAAHEKGIVHRDLKPDNLFVTREGLVKILDFGLAKKTPGLLTGGPPHSVSGTEPGAVLGTVGYMAPEQVRGQPADERSDVFSFGVVLFEMMAGRRAFAKDSPVETMSAILVENPPGLDRLPAGPVAIVRRCLEKTRERRFASMRDLSAALEVVGDVAGPALARSADERVSLAVLPFTDLGPEGSEEYLCEGMAEELSTALGRIDGLRVLARSSALRFHGEARDSRRVGAALGVERVLEGSVRRAGDRVRIAVQLLDTGSGFQIWSERYDRRMEDVLVLQDEIAARVVEALRPRLGVLDPVTPPRRQDRDPEAHRSYLKGRYHWNRRYQGGLRQGLLAFEEAIARDPGHALAHAGLADSWSVLGYYGLVPPREAFARARTAAEKAAALDDLLPEAQVSLGLVRSWFDWDWESAEAAFLRALTLRPDHVPALWFLGHLHALRGRGAEAAALTRRAADLDPVSPISQANAGHVHYLAQRPEEALELCGRALELDPEHPVALFTSALAQSRLGRHGGAQAAARQALERSEGAAFFEGVLGFVEARAGDLEGARERARRLRERAASAYVPALSVAQIYAGLGEREEAFAWLQRAHEERNPYLSNLEAEGWDGLRGDPRFDELLRKMRLGPEAPASTGHKVPSVAVLPFRNLGHDGEGSHLVLGLAEATIIELAGLRSLRVSPLSSVLRYRDRLPEPREAGRELEVDSVVEGTFQSAGEKLRVGVSLVATGDGRTLWATRIEAGLDDLFRLQDEVARSVARALEVELRPAGARPARRAPRAGAVEMYLRGKEHLQRETLPEFIAAVDAFQRARDADPEFALAYAALADAYERIGFQFQPEGDWHGRAVAMCERALALDPLLPEGHYARARLRWSPSGGWDNAGALRDLLAALAGRPDFDEALDRVGVILYHVGLVEEGLAALQRVVDLSPGHTQARYHVGFCRYHQGRYEEAAAISEAVGRVAPASWIHYQTGLCQLRLGRFDDAARTVEMMERQAPGEAMVHPLLGLLAMLREREAEAREQVRLTVEKRRAFGHYHHALYDMACTLSHFGDHEAALGFLREAARSGYPCVALFERDPLLDPLRAHSEFRDLMRALHVERDGYARLYAELEAARSLPPAAPPKSGESDTPQA